MEEVKRRDGEGGGNIGRSRGKDTKRWKEGGREEKEEGKVQSRGR